MFLTDRSPADSFQGSHTTVNLDRIDAVEVKVMAADRTIVYIHSGGQSARFNVNAKTTIVEVMSVLETLSFSSSGRFHLFDRNDFVEAVNLELGA